MKRLKAQLPVLGVFCFALLVRVIYNNTVAHAYLPSHDSLFYQVIGINLLNEHCFCLLPHISTVSRAPLWPFIIAAITILFGSNDYFVRIFLCLIGSGTCVLAYCFARDAFGRRIGMAVGMIAAIYPELYIYDGWLYTESLYIFLLMALCYGLYRLQRTPRPPATARHTASLPPPNPAPASTGAINWAPTWYDGTNEPIPSEGWRAPKNHAVLPSHGSWRLWVYCGVLLGLLSLTRPNGIIVIGLVVVWAIIMVRVKIFSWRASAISVTAMTLIALALIAPWTLRNYVVSHAFIPVATGDGTVLLGAYNDEVLQTPADMGLWINPLKSSRAVTKAYPLFTCTPTCEVARETAYKDHAVQWIWGHIGNMPYLLGLHVLSMWQPDTHEADLPVDRFPNQLSSHIVLVMMKTFPIAIFILAVLGFLVTLRRWREFLFIHLSILLTIAQCLLFYGSARFRAPIEPMLILLAAASIWTLTRMLRPIVHDGQPRPVACVSSDLY